MSDLREGRIDGARRNHLRLLAASARAGDFALAVAASRRALRAEDGEGRPGGRGRV